MLRSIQFLKLLVLVITLAGVVSISSAGTQVWDFENGANDWEVANGEWSVTDGVYQETSGKEKAAHSIVGDVKWENYTVEAKVRFDDGKWAGLIFRAQNEFEYYVFYLNQPDNKTEFWVHKKSAFDTRQGGEPQNFAAKGGVKIESGKWIQMKVKVEGQQFTVFLDGKEQGTATSAIEYKNGMVGVWAWESKASFDNLTVTGEGVSGGTTAVNPRQKLTTTWSQLKRN